MNILLRQTLSVTPQEIYLSIKDLEIVAEFRLSQILHLCTQKSVCATAFRPFGEIDANFPVQLSSRSHFANIENKKKLSPKINVKNIKIRVQSHWQETKQMFLFFFSKFCGIKGVGHTI